MDAPVALFTGSQEIWFLGADEFFVYEDEHAADEWTRVGATDSNVAKMLYVLVKPRHSDGNESHVEVTIVTGDLTPPMLENLQRLEEKLQAEAASRLPQETAA